MEKLEKKSESKQGRPADTIIKNVTGGRIVSTEKIELDDEGVPLSTDELTFKRKYINFAKTAFPEVNPIDYKLPSLKGNEEIRIQNYRYPCDPRVERKGIV